MKVISQLQQNKSTLAATRAEGKYSRLFKRLDMRNGSYEKRLYNLFNYTADVLEGRTGTSGVWCRYHKRFEVMAAMDALVKAYRGSKSTWEEILIRLEYMGLIEKHTPNENPDYNEPKHIESVLRAKSKGYKHAVTWYSIPVYTDKLLTIADERAESVNSITDKDSIRDKVGSIEANHIHDSNYNEHPETTERRQLLRETLAALVDLNGYAYVEAVVTAVRDVYDNRHNNNPVGSEAWERQRKRHTNRVTQTWDGYRDTLLFELGMVYRKPTERERELYGLVTYKYFICRADQSAGAIKAPDTDN